MKKNHTKIIIIIIGILAALAVWFFLVLDETKQETIIDQGKNLFPFGAVGDRNINRGDNNQNTDDQGSVDDQNTQGETEVESNEPRLREISSFPVGGFVPIIRIESQEVPDLIVDEDGNSIETTKTIEVENQYIRYGEIAGGDIYETKVDADSLDQKLLAENIIPNTERIFFSKNGSRAIFQYWNKDESVIESYLGRIEKEALDIEACPFSITKSVKVGDDSEEVFDLHRFLNRNPRTRVASSGINSPGNEGTYATEGTITAIKNFQSLYQLEIDGVAGAGTRAKMLEVCNEQQTALAEEVFAQREISHTISGFFLTQNVSSVTASPFEEAFFYIQETDNGAIGILRDLDDESTQTIFQSPFSEWRSNWASKEGIEITTKPSYQSDGFSYQLNPTTRALSKSLKEGPALITLPNHDHSKILAFEMRERITLLVHNTEDGTESTLDIETFPEKCVWAQDNINIYCAVPDSFSYGRAYPDTWYQGLETYKDSLWKINTDTGESDLLSDLASEYSRDIDVDEIQSDDNNEYLYFTDKNTESLWSYRLSL